MKNNQIIVTILLLLTACVYSADTTHGLGGVVDGQRYEISYVKSEEITAIIKVVRFGEKTEMTKFQSKNGKKSILDGGTPMVPGTIRLLHLGGSREIDPKLAEEIKRILKLTDIDHKQVSEFIRKLIRG